MGARSTKIKNRGSWSAAAIRTPPSRGAAEESQENRGGS